MYFNNIRRHVEPVSGSEATPALGAQCAPVRDFRKSSASSPVAPPETLLSSNTPMPQGIPVAAIGAVVGLLTGERELMTQNLVTLNLTDAQITAVNTALSELETQLAGLISLSAPAKRSARKMGQKSEAFCRQTLRVLGQNPQIVPPNVPVADGVADLTALDALRPIMVRLSRLSDRASDTEMALGSDVMALALRGYGLLKLTGRSEGLEPLRQQLSIRFAKTARQTEPTPEPVAQLPRAA